MPPKISLVRHAEGYHNLYRDYTLPDPLLTPVGKQQCAALSSKFPHHDTVDLVVASPLRRTVQTAAYSFGPTLARPEVPFILHPALQEVAASGSDTGTDAGLLTKAIEDMFQGENLGFDWTKVDQSQVTDGWNSKKGYWAYTRKALSARSADVRNWLFQRPELHIIIVTHGAIAHFITEDWDVEDPMTMTAYQNCEVRDFVFSKSSQEDDAHLTETAESKSKRPAREIDLGAAEGETDPHIIAELDGAIHPEREAVEVGA
ncbi:phosphoglycerate mutase family protein-like protein [Massarina eburnea CBS 473.64]|uniref:Phosphoglycerate mutase family protein-like protein n=1 Tax=Massarina eburnea CBS 473.64 TaxID=1395130 RepID=A0A6A6S8Y3_9PLEO|nr:phosphoglycerate mutase family protein-like protein [Massarina eburnea CBS 473.64]